MRHRAETAFAYIAFSVKPNFGRYHTRRIQGLWQSLCCHAYKQHILYTVFQREPSNFVITDKLRILFSTLFDDVLDFWMRMTVCMSSRRPWWYVSSANWGILFWPSLQDSTSLWVVQCCTKRPGLSSEATRSATPLLVPIMTEASSLVCPTRRLVGKSSPVCPKTKSRALKTLADVGWPWMVSMARHLSQVFSLNIGH